MPTVNIYYTKEEDYNSFQTIIVKLKEWLAKNLTCGDIALTKEEISIRFILVKPNTMIGDFELEVTAHSFSERVKKQDEICLDLIKFINNEISSINNVKAWLNLHELGHSWED